MGTSEGQANNHQNKTNGQTSVEGILDRNSGEGPALIADLKQDDQTDDLDQWTE
jgi:hypothetical protein